MSDLPDRILAAIAEAVRTANCACGQVHPQEEPDLRRCEADKRTVERHAVVGRGEWRDGQPLEYCGSCWRLMPCADLLDRADAYGVALGPLTED